MRRDNVRKGFIENGMVDKNTLFYPDFYKILRTCKIKAFKKEWETSIITNFSRLYKIMKEEGNISEDVYDEIGLPKDFNYKGKLF